MMDLMNCSEEVRLKQREVTVSPSCAWGNKFLEPKGQQAIISGTSIATVGDRPAERAYRSLHRNRIPPPPSPFSAGHYPLSWSILSCPGALPSSSNAHKWLQWVQDPIAQARPEMHDTRTKETSLPLQDAMGTITTFSETGFAMVPRQELSVSPPFSSC